jgi:GT2 family glycosyltransferase
VAIATRDRADCLAACLDALLADPAPPAEIVVVDQSAGDQTRLAVEQRQPGPVSLVYVRHTGTGLGAAQNLALTRASWPILAVTDDDCIPALGWAAAIARLFARCSGLHAVTGRVLPLGPERPGTYAVSSRLSTARAEFARLALPWDVGSGNNFAVRREWLERIGGLDERLGPGAPGQGGLDMDLFYRLLRAGARIRYEPDLVVYHSRASRSGRLARRVPYGYGMGACCTLWLRQGDWHALRVLAAWVLMRARRLARGAARGEAMLVQEEALVLAGTGAGLVYGLRALPAESGP